MTDPNLALSIALAVASIYGLAFVAWLLVRLGQRRLSTAAVLLTPLCLLLIPAEYVAARSGTALLCVDASLKVIDYARQMSRSNAAPRIADFLRFLVPFPQLMVVYRPRSPALADPPAGREIVRLLIGGGLFTLMAVLLKLFQHVNALRESFLLDHTVKFPMFIVAVESLSQALWALERLLGFDTIPIVHWSFLSRTPAEFWVRWNQRVHDWFYRNVFVPWGGLRAPVRGIVLVFLVSAVMHEVAFGIATSRFNGYQFAFFTLQIPVVLASRPLLTLAGKWGPAGTVFARVVTIAWFYVTSMLFLYGVNRALPWFGVYASKPWLP